MVFNKMSDSCSLSSIQRAGTSGHYSLKWKSKGLNAFLIIAGPSGMDLHLEKQGNENTRLRRQLQACQASLKEQGKAELPEEQLEVFRLEFAELMRQGGFSISEKPGSYAVYGLAEQDGEWCVLIPEGDSTYQFSVDVHVEESAVMAEKGLIRKTRYYTGYRKIHFPKTVPGLSDGNICYTVNSGRFSYPVPAEVIASGGSFYIMCSENDTLSFFAGKNSGVKVYVQRRN